MPEQSEQSDHSGQDKKASAARDRAKAYWRANLKLLGKLLAVWFVVSFGFGILLQPFLDQFQFFGFKLGFWFAQQGSIYVFIALIFVYSHRMRKIDRDFGVED